MRKRVLGRTGLEISVMGMGTGGLDPLGQKSGRPVQEMHSLLRRAKDLGVNYFDTSPGYLDSEEILGTALSEYPRDEIVLSTKIALASEASSEITIMTPQQVRESVDSSLRRLKTDYLDIMLMAVSGPEFFERVTQDHLPVLEQCKKEGKIRFIGSSEQTRSDGSHEWLIKVLLTGTVDVAMVGHNMINQSAEQTIFPYCVEHNIGVLNIFTVRNLFWNPLRLREVIADLKFRGKITGDGIPDEGPMDWLLTDGIETLVEAAYRYALHSDGVTAVMCGTIHETELEQNVRYYEKEQLPEHLISRLHELFGDINEAIGN
ncbi:MAG: hypothetical protein HN368_16935 [Spirochaetales bacterium]|jgi:L-galactose dehydrogenase|nr:hypothetical protein [Spirochaetales bacterium]